ARAVAAEQHPTGEELGELGLGPGDHVGDQELGERSVTVPSSRWASKLGEGGGAIDPLGVAAAQIEDGLGGGCGHEHGLVCLVSRGVVWISPTVRLDHCWSSAS